MADITYCVAPCMNGECPYQLMHAPRAERMKASQADRSDGCPDYRPRPEMSPEAREARRSR